jgi:glycosyl transferase family 25
MSSQSMMPNFTVGPDQSLNIMNDTPAIVVINLAHRTDRRVAMQKELSRVGWQAEFFSAIRPEDPAGFPSIGARGCFLSHLAVLKKARDERVQHLVILEDDVNFALDFAERWRIAISALETREWSIFYPAHVFHDFAAGLSRIPPDKGVQCTHFMVINGPAIAPLVVGLERIHSRSAGDPMGGPMHVDGAYSTIRHQNHGLLTYVHSPALGYQRPSRTDDGYLKWFDRFATLAPIVGVVRRLRSKP